MSVSRYNHVRVAGIKTVVPEHYIDIDDELQFFGNDPKRLAKEKKFIGYGRRHVADSATTVCDMACSAAKMLFTEMAIDSEDIDLLIFVNQAPEYPAPCDACLAHGRLGLSKSCAAFDINLGCSGWPYAIMTAHALMSTGGYRKGLVLAGDVPTRKADVENRKKVQLFGDAASATILEYVPNQDIPSTFVCGTDGTGWEALICPFGGMRNPVTHEVLDYSAKDASGSVWKATQSVMKGEDVFAFTLEVASKLINDTVAAAGWRNEDIGLFAIHQANKMIVNTVARKAKLPMGAAPADTFSKYANNSTNSVVTVICDKLSSCEAKKTVACAFGVGLSWAGAALDLSSTYNGGVSLYKEDKIPLSIHETLEHYRKIFCGEA